MPKIEKFLGSYSNQKNRDKNIHVYKLADILKTETCLDLKIRYVDDEITADQTSINVLASNAETNCTFSFAAIIDPSSNVSSFIFCDNFGNEGKGMIDLSFDPVNLKLEITDISDDCTLLYFKEYQLYKVNEIS